MSKKNTNNGNYPEEVIEYAKELFFTPRADGGHAYTLRAISKKIEEKFPHLERTPNYSTIGNWAKRKSLTGRTWQQLWNEGTIKGVVEAQGDIKEVTETQTAEESIVDKISLFNRRLSLIGMDLIIKGYKYYADENYEPEDAREAQAMMKLGRDIFVNQLKELEVMDDRVVNIVFKRTDKQPLAVGEV